MRELVAGALRRRADLLASRSTTALRLFHGRGDGVDGLVIEKLGPVLVVQVHEGRCKVADDALREVCAWLMGEMGATAVYRKLFPRDRSGSLASLEKQLTDPTPWIGAAAPDELEVEEDGLRFLVRCYDGYSTGLFIEHRDNRRRVRERAAGRRVLNAFSYTCAYSAAALAGDAASVTSVDISRKYLEWGKRNLALNGIDPAGRERATFICSDVLDYYVRAGRQGRRFDLVILDPPTFSRVKGSPRGKGSSGKPSSRVFSVERDLGRLVRGAVDLLDAGGLLLLCWNHRETGVGQVVEAIRAAAGGRMRGKVETPPLPRDFAGDAEFGRSVWAQLS